MIHRAGATTRGGPAVGILLGMLLLAVAGCGGGGAGTATSGVSTTTSTAGSAAPAPTSAAAPSPSAPASSSSETARFVSAADAICRRLNVQLSRADGKLSPTGKVTVAALVKGGLGKAILESETLARLRRLRAPEPLAAAWNEILGLRAELVRYVAGPGPASAADRSLEASAHHKLTEAATHASVKECGIVG